MGSNPFAQSYLFFKNRRGWQQCSIFLFTSFLKNRHSASVKLRLFHRLVCRRILNLLQNFVLCGFKSLCPILFVFQKSERVGFEPTVHCCTQTIEIRTLSHSDTSPQYVHSITKYFYSIIFYLTVLQFLLLILLPNKILNPPKGFASVCLIPHVIALTLHSIPCA